jgi:hypothetical protein
VEDQRGEVGRVGGEIAFALEERARLREQVGIRSSGDAWRERATENMG